MKFINGYSFEVECETIFQKLETLRGAGVKFLVYPLILTLKKPLRITFYGTMLLGNAVGLEPLCACLRFNSKNERFFSVVLPCGLVLYCFLQ